MDQAQWMEYVANAATSIIAISFMTSYIGAKYEGAKRGILFIGGVAAYFSMVTVLDMTVHFEGLLGLMYSLVLLIYARAALKGHLWDEMIASWIWVFIALFSSFTVFMVIRFLANHEFLYLIETESRVRAVLLVTITALKIIMSCVTLLILKRRTLLLERKECWAMSVAYMAVFAMVVSFFSIELYGSDPLGRHIVAAVLMCGLLVLVVWISYFYWKLSAYNEEKTKVEFLKNYMVNQKKYLAELGHMYDELRIMRHDLKGQWANIYLMLKGGQTEKAINYIESRDEEIKQYAIKVQMTANQGLNAALAHTIYLCRKEEIQFIPEIKGTVEGFDEADIGTLFYNLLNNAVEACVKVKGKRKIGLKIEDYGGYIKCTLRNSILRSVLLGNPYMKTDKLDVKEHGNGMKSIMRLVEKYEGTYNQEEEAGDFIQSLVLRKI